MGYNLGNMKHEQRFEYLRQSADPFTRRAAYIIGYWEEYRDQLGKPLVSADINQLLVDLQNLNPNWTPEASYKYHDLVFYPDRFYIQTPKSKRTFLTEIETSALGVLFLFKENRVSHKHFIDSLKITTVNPQRTVRKLVDRLRGKLGECDNYIQTIHRIGYILQAP